MLDRQKGEIIFECDGCGGTLGTETGNFDSARNLLRRERWRAVKVGDVWQHNCPACKHRLDAIGANQR